MARPPTIGRKTKGGFEMTSKPFSVAPAPGEVVVTDDAITVDVGEGDSVGEGDGEGVGAGPLSEKLAHGLGCTLAHSLCTPGASPENGLPRVLKLPLPSARAEPATLFCVSQ